MKPGARLRLTLLGGFQAELDPGAVLVLPTKKTQALVAYLALPPGQAHPREKLASLLWGDMAVAQARGNLRFALSRMRKALPRTVAMVLDGPHVALDPSVVDVDVAQFERLVADSRPSALEQIAGLYRGDLLAGLTLGAPPFDAWLRSERERLRELAIEGLGRLLAHQKKTDGAESAAVQTGLRLVALDPLQEPVHRALMQLYARLGRRETALRQYQLCVDALKRELSAPPEAETTRLYQEIQRSRPLHPSRTPVSESAGGDAPARPIADDVPATVPEARSDASPPTNLPSQTSELIGRATALAEVTELLRAHRLVTLIGIGGIGKTRLGLEVARGQMPDHADGVWLAELAPLSDPGLVPVTVAVALGLTLSAGVESPERLASALGAKRLLLVLDNCEHVIDAVAHMAETLLRVAPHARVLATSREPLRAPGEYVYRVPPLTVPAEGIEDRENLLEAAAVQLFAARAQAMDRHFSLDALSAPIAGAVCRRLDGIPLAIELAAARTAVLGIEGLAGRLDDRFRLLTGGHRTALPRHQTLRATLDWSYDLLPAIERTVLYRLAVFAGGFTLEAACAVAADADLAVADVVESVSNLAAKSLVVVELTAGATRYRLLETTRAYALEKLTESAELDLVARRHAEYFRRLFERAETERDTRPTDEWLAVYGGQIDNVRTALDWAFSPGGDLAIGLTLTTAAVSLWFQQSLLVECRNRVERALDSLALRPGRDARLEMQLRAALLVSLMHTKGAGPDTIAAWTTVLELAEGLADTEYQLRALWGLWHFRISRGEFRAALELAEMFSDRVARTVNPADQAVGERLVGASFHYLGDHANARRHLEHMLSHYVETARQSHTIRFQYDQPSVARMILARILWLQGYPDQARQAAQDNVEAARGMGHALSVCGALEVAWLVAIWSGDWAAAERSVETLLDHSARHALTVWHARGRCLKGVVRIRRGEVADGLELLRSTLDGLRELSFVPYYPVIFGTLAQGLAGVGEAALALATIDEALAKSERDEERWWIAELVRIKAELVLLSRVPNAAPVAEAHFQRALRWTREQGARSLELRCASDLARLWHEQGRPGPARELLAPVYARFTEGFETADLRAAKALLESME